MQYSSTERVCFTQNTLRPDSTPFASAYATLWRDKSVSICGYPPTKKKGFTLLEVLLALGVLLVLATLALGGFQALVDTTIFADEALESLHQGEMVMDRLEGSLRSAAFFERNPTLYAFVHEKGAGSPPQDMFSWVTSTQTLLPPNYPTLQGLNRVFVSIEELDGVTGLAVSAYPHLIEPDADEIGDVEPWLLSSRVKGLEVRYYDLTENDWVDEWERNNQLPTSVELKLYVQSPSEGNELIELVRRVDIPVGKVSREARRGRREARE